MISALVKEQYKYARHILNGNSRHFQRKQAERLALEIVGCPRLEEFFSIGKMVLRMMTPLKRINCIHTLNLQVEIQQSSNL